VQYKALTKIPGFENAKMFRPGYAIEYDFFPPEQLKHTLETQLIDNLYFAGQINGTTGYEEAACQGLMAGINAHLKINGKLPFVLNRNQAYIGVLIDDLTTKGTKEPYRMFTSRAEYRILLRQDNADIRLTKLGHDIGLADSDRNEKLISKEAGINKITYLLKQLKITTESNPVLQEIGSAQITEKVSLSTLLKRPEISTAELRRLSPEFNQLLNEFQAEAIEQAEIQLKYEVYIEREEKLAEKIASLEDFKIHPEFDYDRVKALSSEGREKLKRIKPETIGQMSRISGVSPADVSILTIYLGR